ncbi:MAG: hypothetical protein AB199_02680 [Parcubacteria bacterium C7867-004]|nr:MAG: hypothetical protein AB199_02680 [Parcubacteria bacterium C7867-004]
MRDTRELTPPRPYVSQPVSPNPTFDGSLEHLREKLCIPRRMSRRFLFFVAFTLGNRLDSYPESAKEWSERNFLRYREFGWTPDFFYVAFRAAPSRAAKLRAFW